MNLIALQSDPVEFRSALLIDTDAGPQPFSECIEPWQDSDFRALDDGWKRIEDDPEEAVKLLKQYVAAQTPRGLPLARFLP